MQTCVCLLYPNSLRLSQILAMLFNVRQSGDTFASVVCDVLDTLDLDLDGKSTCVVWMLEVLNWGTRGFPSSPPHPPTHVHLPPHAPPPQIQLPSPPMHGRPSYWPSTEDM